MLCKVCGRKTEHADANFCEYCGASFREETSEFIKTLEGGGIQQYPVQQAAESNGSVQKEVPVSFKNYLVSMLLPLIPLAGPIIYIVMLCVWAFDNNTPVSKKNWARATLVVLILGILMLMMMIPAMIPGISSLSGINI